MYRNFDRPFTFDRVIRLIISTALIITGIYVIYVLRNVLLPFLIAWLFAYLLNPIVRFIQNKLRIRNRIIAVTITLMGVVGLVTLIIVLILPIIEQEIFQINSLIYNYQLDRLSIEGVPMEIQDFIFRNIDFHSIKEAFSNGNAAEAIQQYVLPAISGVVSGTITILLGLAIVFIIILYLIFILIDYDKINIMWRNLIPPRYRNAVEKVVLDVEKSMNTYFRHQFLICLILSVLYAVGFQVIGLPLAIILGVFVGLLHMVPYLQVISFIPAVLLCWLKAAQSDQGFWMMLFLVAMVYLIVQCIMDLFLVPKIMGKAMGLNPAVILLSLSVWGYLMGIVGMIIAIPLTTLLLSYYQSFIASISNEQIDIKKITENKPDN